MKTRMKSTVKRAIKMFSYSSLPTNEIIYHLRRNETNEWGWFLKAVILGLLLLLSNIEIHAQSGGWDASGTNGSAGFTDHGNGVIQLLDVNASGCAAGAVHETSDTYDPCSGTVFSKCYEVYFGCPGDDEIGSDQKGDGLAFSFSKCAYNINNGNACGGGLGYMGSCPQMITIEFDTWSSQGNAGFDGSYGGGVSGNNDEIAIHRDGIANDGGKIVATNAGNLEDGLEHTVCISYDPSTHILSVSIDGNEMLAHDFTGSPYELQTYFGCGGLNQTWSSGKFGATNPATVSNAADITDNVGGPLCPASVIITSPSAGTSFGTCDGPFTITAAATPPAGNTVSGIEFFVDGVSIGTDNSEPYAVSWSESSAGNYSLTAIANFSPSGTNAVSSAVNVSIGGGIELTSSAPAIDGVEDAFWGNYVPVTLGNELPIPAASPVSGPSDLSATYQVMRDATNLYILVKVTDDDIQSDGGNNWDNDGVEVFIDMGNDKAGTYGANDYQYAFVYNNPTAIEYKHSPGSLAGVTFAQGALAGGYIMEISIPWATLGGAPSDGELIGFDVHVNEDDADGDSDRDAKIAWADATDQAFNNPSVFGTVSASACNPCPTAVLSGDNTICDDGVATSTLTVTFTGIGPWTFEYSVDGVTQPALNNISASPYTFQSETGAHTYALVAVSDPFATGCSNNTSGTATIDVAPVPTGILSGDNIICDDGSSTSPLTVNLTGTAPWSFIYSVDGVNQPAVTNVNTSTYVFQSASGAHSYALVSVTDSDLLACTGDATGTATIDVTPAPTAVLSGDNVICDENSTSSLTVNLTGTAPWSFIYSIDGVNQPAVTNVNTSTYAFQSASGAHSYALVSVTDSDPSACAGDVAGTATISLGTTPVGYDGTFAPPGSATLSVDDAGSVYEWYDAPIGGNLVFTGPVFATPVLNDTTIYYVQEASGFCRTEVRAIPSGEFFIPNLITPNSDNKNDLFEITALPGGSALKVYNRWGECIYQSDDYDNLWAGNNTADGVYYFDLLLPDGKQYKGWLNIVR